MADYRNLKMMGSAKKAPWKEFGRFSVYLERYHPFQVLNVSFREGTFQCWMIFIGGLIGGKASQNGKEELGPSLPKSC